MSKEFVKIYTKDNVFIEKIDIIGNLDHYFILSLYNKSLSKKERYMPLKDGNKIKIIRWKGYLLKIFTRLLDEYKVKYKVYNI